MSDTNHTTLTDRQRRERMEREKAEQLGRERRERDRRASQTTDFELPSIGMINEGVKELLRILDHRSCNLAEAVSSIYRQMERVRRQESAHE